MARLKALLMVFLAIAVLGFVFGGRNQAPAPSREPDGSATGRQVARNCESNKADVDDMIRAAEGLRAVRKREVAAGEIRPVLHLTIDERLWAETPYENKKAVLLAYFCQVVQANGRGAVFATGYRNGKVFDQKVIDGQFYDEPA